MSRWPTTTLGAVAIARPGNGKIIKGTLPTENDGRLFPAYSATGQDVFSEEYDHDGEGIVVSAVGARCGKCFMATGRWRAIANTHVLLPRKDKVLPRFLWYLINDEKFWVKGGTAQPFVKINDSLKNVIPLPPLAEQARIVRILDEVEALRRLRAQTVERTDAIIPAVFNALFGPAEAQRSAFSSKALRELCSFVSGATPSTENPDFWTGEIPWVSPKDMKTVDVLDAIDHVSETALRASRLRLLPENTVLIVIRGMILAHTLPVAVARVPVTINQDMKGIILADQMIPEYLLWCLKELSPRILSLVSTSGHGTKRIEMESLTELRIPVPPLQLQRAFADRVAETRKLETAQAASRRRLDDMFQSLLHRVFREEL